MHNPITMGRDQPTSARKRSILNNRMMRRHRVVERSIRNIQRSPNNVMPYVSFSRVVREILATHGNLNMRSDAMRALQCATEQRLTDMFSEALRLATYHKRDTVVQTDIQFVIPPNERPVAPAVLPADMCASILFPLPEPVQ